MSSISQTVPNYVLGMSEQPDQLKSQGQVRDLVNGIPDVTRMLSKRPGTETIREMIGNTAHNGHWFSIYKADDQQYIARILPADGNGTIDVWRLVDGPLNRPLNKPNGPPENSTRAYVNVPLNPAIPDPSIFPANKQGIDSTAPNFDSDFEDVPIVATAPSTGTNLTVNCRVDADGNMLAAYINNQGSNWKSQDVGTGTINGETFDIIYFEGIAGEKCRVNYDSDYISPYSIRLGEFNDVLQPRNATNNSAYLQQSPQKPGDASIFKTLTVNDTTVIVNSNIITKLINDPETAKKAEGFVEVIQIGFEQVYKFDIIPETGNTVPIIGTESGTDATTTAILTDLKGKVDETDYKATIIGNGLYIEHDTDDTKIFSLSTPDRQLLSVFTDEVQDISAIPDQCKNGYRLKIINSGTLEDDYYVKFEGANNKDGQGVWTEWRAWPQAATTNPDRPAISGNYKFDKTTMPHILVGMSDLSFMLTPGNYDDREIGDENSNPNPSFLNSRINNVCLFRNRLGFLSKQDIILSRPEDFFNFWVSTALAVTPKDPIDLRTSSTSAATLFDSIEVNAGLMLFSKTEQYMLTTDNDILSAETAKINFVSAYNYNEDISPFTLGTTIGFLNDESSNSRLYEMTTPAREGEPQVIEQSKIISSLYPTGINRIATSKNNAVVLTCKSDDNTIWGYRYFNTSEKRLQSAWFKFEMSGNVIYHTIIKDTWYGVIRNLDTVPNPDVNIVSFQKMDLKNTDYAYNYKDVNYRDVIRLDNKIEIPNNRLTFNNGVTTFNLNNAGYKDGPWTYDQTKVNGTATGVKCFQIGSGIDEECVDIKTNNNNHENRFNNTFTEITLDGNWKTQTEVEITTATATGLPEGKFNFEATTTLTGTGSGMELSGEVENNRITNLVISSLGNGYANNDTIRLTKAANSVITVKIVPLTVWVGYEYELDVEMPTIYPVRQAGQGTRADVNGSLVLHRCKFNMAKIGTYEFDLERTGRLTFTHDQETRYADSYDANDAPILNTDTVTLPVYDRNINTNIHLKSEYPLPVTLISMTWEGEYTNLSYRRS